MFTLSPNCVASTLSEAPLRGCIIYHFVISAACFMGSNFETNFSELSSRLFDLLMFPILYAPENNNWAVPLSSIILRMNKEPFYSLTKVCFTSSDFIFCFRFQIETSRTRKYDFPCASRSSKGGREIKIYVFTWRSIKNIFVLEHKTGTQRFCRGFICDSAWTLKIT